MTPDELLATLTALGCRVLPDGVHLRVQDPQQALTDDLRQAIREHKQALLTVLTPSTPQAGPAPLDPDYPCVLCGRVGRWNDRGIWRCVTCWPQAPQRKGPYGVSHRR